MSSELNTGAFTGTDSRVNPDPEFSGPTYVPRRGPVLVSSDEESEPKSPRPQVFRALSRTPSQAKSNVSSQDAFRPVGFSESGSDTDSDSNSKSNGGKRKKRSGSASSRSSTEYTGSRASLSVRSTVADSIASGGSDSEREPDLEERIRHTRAGNEGNSSRRVLPPPGSGWGSGDSGDSGEEFDSEGASPQPGRPSSKQGSVSRRVSGRKQNSGTRSSSYRYAESGSSVEFVAPDSAPEMLGSEASDSGDNSGKEFKLKTSRRPGQSFSERGSDSKSLRSAAPDLDRGPGIRSSNSTNTVTKIKKSGGAKFPGSRERSHKAKKRTYKLNPDYIRLLNDDIRYAASRGKPPVGSLNKARGSRTVMGSVWTLYENNRFFKYLSIVGKDNLLELARGVGTKSIVECRAYLKTLQDAKKDAEFRHIRRHRGRDLISAEDIPAAVELSDECVKALELDADYLEFRTRRHEERVEKAKWGDSWLLDSTVAEHIEHLYRNKCIEEIRDIAPEAELLNLDMMLDLSGRVFMYGPEENNWTHWSEEPPSIRHTALSDIHTLVVSLTRRLVQTALFMAMSRLRGMDSKIFRPQSLVRPSDVTAAIDCLGAPRKAKYWVTLPRRLRLKVYMKAEQIRLKTDKNVMPYVEVEDYLERIDEQESTITNTGDKGSKVNMDSLILSAFEDSDPERNADDELSDLDDSVEIDNGGPNLDVDAEDGYQFVDDAGQIYRSKTQRILEAKMATLEGEEDAIMEALDRKHSLETETTLWQMMGKEPSKPRLDTAEFEREPARGKKRFWEVSDWRDGVNYLAPWETIKRRKVRHGGVGRNIVEEEEEEEEVVEEEEEDETYPRMVVKNVTEAPLSRLGEVLALQKAGTIPWKRPVIKKKKKQIMLEKPPMLVPNSPRESRIRRQSKTFSGYVSTFENVTESDVDALAREEEDDDSPSDEEHGNG